MPQLACAWADVHYLDSAGDDYQPLIQRACARARTAQDVFSIDSEAGLKTIVAKAIAGDAISGSGCQVGIQPVLDSTEVAPVDGYEIRSSCGRRSEPARSPTSSPSEPVSVHEWTWTTPSAMWQWTTVDRQARPAWGTWAHLRAPVIEQSPTADGRSTSPSRLLPTPLTHRLCLHRHQPRHLALGRNEFNAAVWQISAPKPAPIPA